LIHADSRLPNSLEDNPLIERATYFLASIGDAKGGHAIPCGKYKF
jgi:hypothetical protein